MTRFDPDKETDALIVGAGAVGLACGYALASHGLRVIVIEAGPRIGEGVSARNSEVIHAGSTIRRDLCERGSASRVVARSTLFSTSTV